MRLKLALLGAVVVAVVSPVSMCGAAQHVHNAVASDKSAYDRLCPLLSDWVTLDGASKRASGAAIKKAARHISQDDRLVHDSGAKAFINAVPVLIDGSNKAQTRTAHNIVQASCHKAA